jgi:hypothetical protein
MRDEVNIKVVVFNEIYNFIVNNFSFKIVWSVKYTIQDSKLCSSKNNGSYLGNTNVVVLSS